MYSNSCIKKAWNSFWDSSSWKYKIIYNYSLKNSCFLRCTEAIIPFKNTEDSLQEFDSECSVRMTAICYSYIYSVWNTFYGDCIITLNNNTEWSDQNNFYGDYITATGNKRCQISWRYLFKSKNLCQRSRYRQFREMSSFL